MLSFITDELDENCIEFDFRNLKWTKGEVDARKKEIKLEICEREFTLENLANTPGFDDVQARIELRALENEKKTIRPGKHRFKDVFAVYSPARIFGPSPRSGLTPSQCNILKALPMQVTRNPRNNDRCDKALVIKIDSGANEIGEPPVPVYPKLESGEYISFNGNGRRRRNHGHGFKIATWMKDIGYSSPSKYRVFFRDLKSLLQPFGLVVVGWSRVDRRWCTLDEMLEKCRSKVGRAWLVACVLRIYASGLSNPLPVFRKMFGFASLPGGEGEITRFTEESLKPCITIQNGTELQPMRQHGHTDEKLAAALGINRATVTHYRNGARRWSKKFGAIVEKYFAELKA